jgi:octaprenyl-diphosphate synthase
MTDYTTKLKKIEDVLFEALENDRGEREYPLAPPVKKLMALGGKRWRPLLMVLCAELAHARRKAEFGGDCAQSAYHIAPLIEFAHTASLVHDDIEDSSETRRGQPAAHLTWGVDTALNAASWLYFKAAEGVETAPLDDGIKNALYALYARQLRSMHLGQAMDILWHRDKAFFPTPELYMTMARRKTGALAELAARAGMITGSGGRFTDADALTRAVGDAASGLGSGFQILDDVTNLVSGNPGKTRGDDVVEGKKSFVIVAHLEARPRDAPQIAAYFEQAAREGINSAAVSRLIDLANGSGALERASEAARNLIEASCARFETLFPAEREQVNLITNLFASMAG